MESITFQLIQQWLRDRGISILQDGKLQKLHPLRSRIRLQLPPEPHKLPWFARDIFCLVSGNARGQTLFWICEWRIWSEEIESIGVDHLRRFRSTYGPDVSLEEFPGQLIGPTETNGGVSLLMFPLLFGWDAYLVGASGDPTVFISHDEFIDIEISDPAVEVAALEKLQEWMTTADKNRG